MGAEDLERGATWQTDIALLVLSGPVFAYGDLLLENCGATFQEFKPGAERWLPEVPKLGGYFDLYTIRKLGLSEEATFLTKLAAEEILHTFAVPKGHDSVCFFHPQGETGEVRHDYDYSTKCLTLMATLAEPISYEETYRLIDERYLSEPKPG